MDLSRDRYAELDAIVRAKEEAAFAFASALWEIRETGLYLLEFDAFEDYLNARLGIQRRTAYQKLAAWERVKELEPSERPDNEAQARALGSVSTPVARAALTLARAALWGKLTAAEVRTAASHLTSLEETVGELEAGSDLRQEALEAYVRERTAERSRLHAQENKGTGQRRCLPVEQFRELANLAGYAPLAAREIYATRWADEIPQADP